MIFSVVALSMTVFAEISKEALPKRRKWVNIESLVFVKEPSILLINCAQEGVPLISKQGAVKKKVRICFNIKATRTRWGFRLSWKLCLNLCSREWLRPRRSFVRYLIPLQLWQLNTMFGDGLINFNKFFLKTLRLAVLRRLGTNLFHSIIVDGKKFFEKVIFSAKKSNFICISGIAIWIFCWY